MRTVCRSLPASIALILFTFAIANAQGLSAGVVIGLNASTRSDFGNVGPATERRALGVVAGISLDVPIARSVSLQPEVVYAHREAPGWRRPCCLAPRRLRS